MYEYKCRIVNVVDGDTLDVDIDLGFNITLTKQRIRLSGLNTAESRTTNKIEKAVGLFTTQQVKKMFPEGTEVLLLSKQYNAETGKFGRILGDIKKLSDTGLEVFWSQSVTSLGLAVPYGTPTPQKQANWESVYHSLMRRGFTLPV